jgi:hypothetical protein
MGTVRLRVRRRAGGIRRARGAPSQQLRWKISALMVAAHS